MKRLSRKPRKGGHVIPRHSWKCVHVMYDSYRGVIVLYGIAVVATLSRLLFLPSHSERL